MLSQGSPPSSRGTSRSRRVIRGIMCGKVVLLNGRLSARNQKILVIMVRWKSQRFKQSFPTFHYYIVHKSVLYRNSCRKTHLDDLNVTILWFYKNYDHNTRRKGGSKTCGLFKIPLCKKTFWSTDIAYPFHFEHYNIAVIKQKVWACPCLYSSQNFFIQFWIEKGRVRIFVRFLLFSVML